MEPKGKGNRLERTKVAINLALASVILWAVYLVSILLTIFYMIHEASILLVEWAQDRHTKALREYERKR